MTFVIDLWQSVKDWSPLADLLLRWSNIVEDIRIERRGNEQFPGASGRMFDLQDFILDQETEARAKGNLWTPLDTAQAVFRDAGLGYVTVKSQEAFFFYQTTHPGIFDMIVKGSLRPLLDQAIAMRADDDLGCLRLTMEILSQVANLAQKHRPPKTDNPCPSCGASSDTLIVRPNNRNLGLIILCPSCGHYQEVSPTPGGGEASSEKKQEETNAGAKGQNGQKGTKSKNGSQGQKGTKSKDGAEGQNGQKGTKGKDSKDPQNSDAEGGTGTATNQWSEEDLAQIILSLVGENLKPGLTDFSSAMEEALDKRNRVRAIQVKTGESPWNPLSTDMDELLPVPKGSTDTAVALLEETREITSYLQGRLRTMLLAFQESETEHGHKRGHVLSARNLVNTRACVRNGEEPRKAFCQTTEGLLTSFAGVVVMDQSGSMNHHQDWMARCMFALAIPMDYLATIGCALMITGFQCGKYDSNLLRERGNQLGQYHRSAGVKIHLYKNFNTRVQHILGSMVNIQTGGGTPMADGIQFGLHALQGRSEHHQAIFVITDGKPDGNHTPVIKWQQRIARKSGKHIIGVGVGKNATSVQTLFKDHVWVPSFDMLPNPLVAKLSMLINPFDQKHRKPLRLEAHAWR
jgi:predicted RNA-binding Zn-ribbon protein involved in translation (DUF1610 family)